MMWEQEVYWRQSKLNVISRNKIVLEYCRVTHFKTQSNLSMAISNPCTEISAWWRLPLLFKLFHGCYFLHGKPWITLNIFSNISDKAVVAILAVMHENSCLNSWILQRCFRITLEVLNVNLLEKKWNHCVQIFVIPVLYHSQSWHRKHWLHLYL